MSLSPRAPRSLSIGLALVAALAASTVARAATPGSEGPGGGVSCSDAGMIPQLIANQLRDDPTAPGTGWRLRYRVESSTDARWIVRVDVLGDNGRLYLTRALNHSTGDCQTLAQAAALIVERFFTDLDWTSGRPLPPPAELSVTPPPASVSPPAPVNVLLTARAGAWTRSQRAASGALGLRLERGHLDGELSFLVPAADQEQARPEGGKATLSALGAAVSLGGRWQAPHLQLRAGPVAVVDYEWARTEAITLQKNSTRWTLAAGLAAGTSYVLSPRWRVGLDAWGTVAALADRFVVVGWGPVLAPPRFQVAALLGAAFVLAP